MMPSRTSTSAPLLAVRRDDPAAPDSAVTSPTAPPGHYRGAFWRIEHKMHRVKDGSHVAECRTG